jgi:hypothetical protein
MLFISSDLHLHIHARVRDLLALLVELGSIWQTSYTSSFYISSLHFFNRVTFFHHQADIHHLSVSISTVPISTSQSVIDSVFCFHLLLAAAYTTVLFLVVYSLKWLPMLLIDSRYVVTKVDIYYGLFYRLMDMVHEELSLADQFIRLKVSVRNLSS